MRGIVDYGPGKTNATGAKWVQGAALLGAAAVISKLLGTIQKIPLQNIAGDEAYGIYTVVYPFYILILFLATAGFPVAVSAFVSERITKGDMPAARRVLKVALVLLTISGMGGFVLLFFGAGTLAGWIGNSETEPAIQSVSFALLFVPIMSALRGYFQGCHDMMPTAVSQVAEQFVRVGTMIAVLIMLTSWSITASWVAAGATFGAVTGALVGMLVMLVYWGRHNKQWRVMNHTANGSGRENTEERYSSLTGRMILFALPVCLGAIAVPIISIVDTFTLPRLLRMPGMSDLDVMKEFGVYARGLPLVQMAAMLVSSISVALVPAIAEARTMNDWRSIRARTELSVRFTWFIGTAASVGLAVTALPVNIMLYKDSAGTMTIVILAFTAMFSTVNIITASVLQGIGAVMIPAINLLIASLLKVLLNFLCVPVWGINGAALAGVAAFAIAAVLNIAAIHRATGATFPFMTYFVKTGLALICMSAILAVIIAGVPELAGMIAGSAVPGGAGALQDRLFNTLIACSAIIAGMVVYGATLFRLRAVTPRDLVNVPGAERRLLPLLRKLRLLGKEADG